LKPLYIWGHIHEKLIYRMLVDGNATAKLMLYTMFKNLRWEDDELVKTSVMLNDVGGNPMESRGVISMELTMESKLLATTFFIIEVQGTYSIILCRDWIHDKHCIQWIKEEVQVVHMDASAYIALTDATAD
jgi:hypothetical protein